MLQNLFYTLPELSLFIGIIHLYLRCLFDEDSPKLYAQIARVWLLVSFFCTILFYNRSMNAQYFESNSYTLLFKTFISIFAYIILGLAPQYFSAEKKTGCKFYILFLLSLITINMMLTTINILMLAAGYIMLLLIHYRLQEIGEDKKNFKVQARYISTNAMIFALLIVGVTGIYHITGGETGYRRLADIFAQNASSFTFYMYAVCLIIPFLYALGIPPFHSFTEDRFGKAILPAGHYFAVVAPWAYWGAFIKLNIILIKPFAVDIAPVYILFAFLSVIFGAIGANTRINLHRIYSFCLMYYFGIMLLLLSQFNAEADFAAVLNLIVCMLGINGVYLVFYSLKSRNEYLSATVSLSGLAETRPYATAVLLISLFSLLGMPPLAGFLGITGVAVELTAAGKLASLGLVFACLLMLANCYLEIIKTAYFEHKIINYDVENKNLRFYMLLNIICIATAAFNPFNLMEIIKDMFYVIFI